MRIAAAALAFMLLLTAGLVLASTDSAPRGWRIGPVIDGRNYSPGMPASPEATADGWTFAFPGPSRADGHVHYVWAAPGDIGIGDLEEAKSIALRFDIEAAAGTRFVPQQHPGQTATVSLVIQRRGDRWNGQGEYAYYRWYSPAESLVELAPGSHELRVPLTGGDWISVFGQPSSDHATAFRAALAEPARIGLVFGSASARGHGVYATGPARFTLTAFDIEQ